MRKSLAGTGTLSRLILRRDRIALAVWVIGFGLLPLGIAASFDGLYPTAEALRAFTGQNMSNPTILGMLGPIYSPTLGGLVAWRIGVMSMLIVGIVSLILVTRHTRGEEESGRRELLGATVVGRQAPLTAALGVTCATSLMIGIVVALGLISYGLPVPGSVALGLSVASSGVIFASIGAATAQMTETVGGARGIGLAVFVMFLVLRIAGDAGGPGNNLSWLSWLSPLAWIRLTRPFADERWWMFALIVAFCAVVVAVAFVLSSRRDLGAGLIPARPGPATASPGLSSPLALAWRLQRGTFFGWAMAFAAIGVLLGAVGQSVSEILDAPGMNSFLDNMGAGNSGDAFLFFIVYIMSQVASAYAILAVLKMRSEETSCRADPVLSTAVGRLRWAGSHMFFAVTGPVIMLILLGLAIGTVYGLSTGDAGQTIPDYLGTALVKVPAVWAVAGLAFALYGLLPGLSAYGSWGALFVFVLLELGWELRQVGDTVFGISPFAHVHPFVADVTVATVIWLLVVAIAFTALGLLGFRRRDIA